MFRIACGGKSSLPSLPWWILFKQEGQGTENQAAAQGCAHYRQRMSLFYKRVYGYNFVQYST
jgi:hypothetical protein